MHGAVSAQIHKGEVQTVHLIGHQCAQCHWKVLDDFCVHELFECQMDNRVSGHKPFQFYIVNVPTKKSGDSLLIKCHRTDKMLYLSISHSTGQAITHAVVLLVNFFGLLEITG